MTNIERFPSKQMYSYLSLVERKVAEFYHDIDRSRYLVWLKWRIFIAFYGQLMDWWCPWKGMWYAENIQLNSLESPTLSLLLPSVKYMARVEEKGCMAPEAICDDANFLRRPSILWHISQTDRKIKTQPGLGDMSRPLELRHSFWLKGTIQQFRARFIV